MEQQPNEPAEGLDHVAEAYARLAAKLPGVDLETVRQTLGGTPPIKADQPYDGNYDFDLLAASTASVVRALADWDQFLLQERIARNAYFTAEPTHVDLARAAAVINALRLDRQLNMRLFQDFSVKPGDGTATAEPPTVGR